MDDPFVNIYTEFFCTFWRKECSLNLKEVYQLKDHLRSIIFSQAEEWLKIDKLKSFVYPVNHWKLSGSGAEQIEWDLGQNKFLETIELPQTMVIFADVHREYPSRTYGKGGLINYSLQHFSKISGKLTEFLKGHKIIPDALEYPFAEHAKGKSASLYKDLLMKIQDDTKILDLHVVLPSQEISDTMKKGWPGKSWWKFSEGFDDPDTIMIEGNKYRQLVDDLRENPKWIYNFKHKIPLEPNYSFGGPEYS